MLGPSGMMREKRRTIKTRSLISASDTTTCHTVGYVGAVRYHTAPHGTGFLRDVRADGCGCHFLLLIIPLLFVIFLAAACLTSFYGSIDHRNAAWRRRRREFSFIDTAVQFVLRLSALVTRVRRPISPPIRPVRFSDECDLSAVAVNRVGRCDVIDRRRLLSLACIPRSPVLHNHHSVDRWMDRPCRLSLAGA